MIKIEPAEFEVDIVRLKAVTTAIGGSITVVDEEASAKTGKQVLHRIPVPTAVARSFLIKTKKMTRYMVPPLVAVVRYGDLVVALERHPLASMGALEETGIDGKLRRWRPACQANLEDYVLPQFNTLSRTWYFDGRYAYTFEGSLEHNVREGKFLSRDGHFRKVVTMSIDLQELSTFDKLSGTQRTCLAYVAGNGQFALSPPIWKNISDIGGTAAKRRAASLDEDDDGNDLPDDDGEPLYTFDDLDRTMCVNLNFALAAGYDIGKTFGYEYVEPLNLPRLMVELKTTNLPNEPQQIKATYDIGMKFTHAMAWLIGMSLKANTLDTHRMMRAQMKYLTKRGLFSKTLFHAENVFQEGKTVEHVRQVNVDQLLAIDPADRDIGSLLQQARRVGKRKAKDVLHSIGGLLNEED